MITAIVPARGGSKRLPNKNVKLLAGRPLIFYTLDALIGHEMVSKVVFTTDSDDYINKVLSEYGDKVVIEKRPEYYAADTTKVYDEIVRLADTHVIDTEWFMLCLPTAPLRSFDTVSRLLRAWKSDGDPRFSASKYEFPIQFAFDIDDSGAWYPIQEESPMVTGNTRSQDIPTRYRPNGAIYLHKTSSLKINKTFYLGAKPFLISEVESTDVDTAIDFKFAEILMSEYSNDC